jgi:hypothetical protein
MLFSPEYCNYFRSKSPCNDAPLSKVELHSDFLTCEVSQ